jgi:hypothetical protein
MTDVDGFLDAFRPAVEAEEASSELLAEYRGIVPDRVIEFWERFGFAGHGVGQSRCLPEPRRGDR